MIKKLQPVLRAKIWDYFILVSRFLLAFVFLSYGFGKLMGGQFGISPEEMKTPIKDLSLFRVMWYLFDHEPIKTTVGILQVITGILLIWNRTVILGVLFFIVIGSNILLMDISFMDENMASYFTIRFAFYFLLCGLILWHYRDRMKLIFNAMFKGISTKFKFPVWSYFLVPVLAFCLEFASVIPKVLYLLFSDPVKFYDDTFYFFKSVLEYIF